MPDRPRSVITAPPRSTWMQPLVAAPGWLLLVALTFAPWAFGSVHKWALAALNVQLGVILFLWLAGCIVRREAPHVPKLLAGAAGGVIVLGWLAVLNARFDYDPQALAFQPLNSFLKLGPGSIHRSLSVQSVLQWTLLLGVMGFVCDLARQSQWRKRLLLVVALNGAGIAAVGVLQRMTAATSIYWGAHASSAFFSAFVNHDHAAAFLNTAWPLLGAGLLLALERKASLAAKSLWSVGVFLTLAAVIVSGSRAGSLLAFGLFGVAFSWFAWRTWQGDFFPTRRLEALAGSFLVLLLLAAGTAIIGMEISLSKWARLASELNSNNYRWLAYQVCLDMVPQAGWWGFGPGTFQTAFPYFTNHLGDAIKGRWLHAHQDYFQFAIEWGCVGAGLFATCIFGALFRCCRVARSEHSLRAQIRCFGVVLAVLGVLLHSLVDFPLQIPAIQLYFTVLLGILWQSQPAEIKRPLPQ